MTRLRLLNTCARVACALLLLFGAGCVERRLFIRSDPPGATVRVNGEEIGVTPATWRFDKYGRVLVEVELSGHRPDSKVVDLDVPWFEYPVIDFFSDVLAPARIRDDHEVSLRLEPWGEPTEEEIVRRMEALAQSAERARSEAMAR
jgi:hypothetical protein